MARARNIKPGLYKNEDLAECSIWARYLFPGLWTLADRDGRLEDRPKRIKAELLPFDTQDVEPLLRELAEKQDNEGVPFIVRYQNSDGRFIQISKFSKHQTPHYSEKKSVIKPAALPENEGHTSSGNSGSPPPIIAQTLPEHSGNSPSIKEGSQPPDSLIHRFSDSPTPDSLNPESGLPSRARAQKRAAKTPLPPDFTVSERVIAWAASKGFDRLPEHLEAFMSKVRQHGYRYVDWDEALMTAIREDWARLRNGRAKAGDHSAAIAEAERRIFGPGERDITDESKRV